MDVASVCGYVARRGGLRAAYLNGETLGRGNSVPADGEGLFRIGGVEGLTADNFLVLLGMEAEEKGCRVRDITALVEGEDEYEEKPLGYRYIAVDGAVREELELALSGVAER